MKAIHSFTKNELFIIFIYVDQFSFVFAQSILSIIHRCTKKNYTDMKDKKYEVLIITEGNK